MSEEHSKLPRLSEDERRMMSLLNSIGDGMFQCEVLDRDERYIDAALCEGMVEDIGSGKYGLTLLGRNFLSTMQYSQSLNLYIRRKEQEAKAAVFRVSKNGTLLDQETYNAYQNKEMLVEAAQQVAKVYGDIVGSLRDRGLVEVDSDDGWKLQATQKGLNYLKMSWEGTDLRDA
mgnify:CR=1 FL=1